MTRRGLFVAGALLAGAHDAVAYSRDFLLFFSSGSVELTERHRAVMAAFADYFFRELQTYDEDGCTGGVPAARWRQMGVHCTPGYTPPSRVEVQAHADDGGSGEQERRLSLRRGATVAEALAGLGFPPERIVVAGFGADESMFARGAALGPGERAQNRRVRLVPRWS